MAAPETHFEPFLHLAGLGDDEALIAWGGFWFRRDGSDGRWRLVDDSDVPAVAGEPRAHTIGARSEPYGRAVVEVEQGGRTVARAEVSDRNHAWLRGLQPDAEHRYRVWVDGRPWAAGELCDWDPAAETLVRADRRYENRFRTFPRADAPVPVTFAVLGDFGVGILRRGEDSDRQARLAAALERSVDRHGIRLVLTVGDNVYLGREGTVSGTGDEDDDWYGSFYQPYRHLLNRVPFFPAVGNHDAADTERADDREQLSDNYFVEERFRPHVLDRRASLDPGLFYRFGAGALVEFICIDTSVAGELRHEHYFDNAEHRAWLRETLGRDGAARWRIPFCHHPPFCAGPNHPNTGGLVERVVPLLREAGVRLMLSGHEHNFQHSSVDGIDYVISGAAGKLRREPPTDFAAAGTRAWAAGGHWLLVDVDAERVRVRPVAGVAEDGALELLDVRDPAGAPADPTIVVR